MQAKPQDILQLNPLPPKKQGIGLKGNTKSGKEQDFYAMISNKTNQQPQNKLNKITEENTKVQTEINTQQNASQNNIQTIPQKQSSVTELVEQVIGEEGANTIFAEANMLQLLAVLEIINAPKEATSTPLFPNLGDKLANLLSVPQNAKALSEVKSIDDLIDFAKKLNLNLGEIKISKQDIDMLKDKFPNLTRQNFFTPIKQTVPDSNFIIKSQVEQNLKNTKSVKAPILAELLQADIQDDEFKPVSTIEPKILKTNTIKDLNENINIITDQDKKIPNTIKENNAKPEINLKTLIFGNDLNDQKQIQTQSVDISKLETAPIENIDKTNKTELSFDAKMILHEAKSQINHKIQLNQTITNFSTNLAEQVANYKAPFTRVSMNLNPINLGEIDVVMIQRGNNLHINFNSNVNTMNLFLQNQAEFKNSLVNMGFTELSMNFNNNGNSPQHQQENRPKYHGLPGDLDEQLNGNEPSPISLELILPQYV